MPRFPRAFLALSIAYIWFQLPSVQVLDEAMVVVIFVHFFVYSFKSYRLIANYKQDSFYEFDDLQVQWYNEDYSYRSFQDKKTGAHLIVRLPTVFAI